MKPRHTPLREMLSSVSSRTPDAIAIVAPGRAPLSYSRLTGQIDATTAALRALGIEHDDRVATVLPDGPEAAVGALSVACAAACAPLDPRSGPAEVEAALLALRARAVIVSGERASSVVAIARRSGLAILELQPLEREAGSFTLKVLDCARERAPRADGPEGLALVLRTSGTTAASKLVPLTHANLCSSIARVTAALALGPRDRYLNVTPMFYSQGIMLTLASLGAGSSVVCTAGFDAAQFFDWLDEFQPTWYSAAPAVHHALLAQARTFGPGHRHHQLRFIRSAAAPLPGHVRQDLERLFDAPVINAYGMTECYPIAVTPLPPLAGRPGSVGVAAGTGILIVNERGDAMPHGVTGEIAVRGPHVTPGYLNHPSGSDRLSAEGWFRTGDQGHLDRDNFLFVTGRIKELINRGGEKVCAGEIDDVLLRHPAVAEAAAFGQPHPTLGEDVAAAVVLRKGERTTESELRALAAAHLVPFKTPRAIYFVESLPKSTTGKVRRHVLADTVAQSPERLASRAPSSAVQRQLVQIFIQLLGVTSIGMHENFFDHGGNSLLAMQLVTEVEKAFGRLLPLAAVLQAPTVEQLANVIVADTAPPEWSALAPIQAAGSKPPFFWVHGDASTGFLPIYLAPDQPLYGLEHQGQDGRPPRYRTVEAIAGHYLEHIYKVQPRGPFYLGGFSFGGTVAFEIAQRMRRDGHAVGLLVMLDSHFPGEEAARNGRDVDSVSTGLEVRRHVHGVLAHHPRGLSAYVIEGLKWRAQRRLAKAAEPFKTLWCEVAVGAGRPIPRKFLSHYLVRLYRKALDRYEAQPYTGSVMYVKSEQRSPYHRAQWARITGCGFEIFEIPGQHMQLVVQPHARPWAERIQGWLDAAHRRQTASSITEADPDRYLRDHAIH